MPQVITKIYDISSSEEPVIVVPLTPDGQLDPMMDVYSESTGLDLSNLPTVPSGELFIGDTGTGSSSDGNLPLLIYVSSENASIVNYSGILNIGRKLAEYCNIMSIPSIAIPAIGAGLGKLDVAACIQILKKAFEEAQCSTTMVYYLYPEQETAYKTSEKSYTDQSAIFIAFRTAVLDSTSNSWIRELIMDQNFYFELARDKFQEFRNFVLQNNQILQDIFNELENNWKGSFQRFLDSFPSDGAHYRLILLCGELIAYIDQRGANKKIWNQNPDKRTIARAGVRQKDWLYNLLRFKMVPDALNSIPESILNAILYLQAPSRRLTMLSGRHRTALCKNIFQRVYNKESDLELFLKMVEDMGVVPVNSENFGAICSRLAYLPEIKSLWLLDETQDINEAEEDSDEGQPSIRGVKTIAPTIHSDLFADTDLLDYDLYAEAITAFIKHKNSHPPLSIGILAPWGKGKTTLMRFIQNKLRTAPKRTEESTTNSDLKNSADQGKIYPSLKKRLNVFILRFKFTDLNTHTESTNGLVYNWLINKKDQFITIKQVEYPTVWFNAWKFQKTEQLWSGFAYEIIRQLVEQLPTEVEREKFWLRLNLKRINREKLKQDIVLKSFKALWPGFLMGIVTILFGFFIWIIPKSAATPWLLGLNGVSVIYTVDLLTRLKKAFQKAKPELDIAKYLRQPEYLEKRGLLLAIEDDLKEVMKLIVAEDAPAVIFIDDLDRCSPVIVAEMVEAINLFISGDLPRCYFILGQDAQMVAASLDIAYEKIGEKIKNIQNDKGSLGWYFMEKFIQLQFNIPVLSVQKSKSFLNYLLNANREGITGEQQRTDILKKADEFKEKINSAEDLTAVVNANYKEVEKGLSLVDPLKMNEIKGQIIQKAAEEFDDDDPEILDMVESLGAYLGDSPRSIKRFVNLYRFYKFLQYTRFKFEDELEDIHLSQWIVIMIRWPQLVRAIQWDTEEFFDGQSSLERASRFESLFRRYKTHIDWLNYLNSIANQLKWLEDEELFNFLALCETENNTIENAVNTGVW